MSDSLDEYRAAVAKIDAAAAAVFARRADDVACERGCSSCCVDGLTVLSVEAAAIERLVDERGLSAEPAPPPGGCGFLDATGACTVYEARPVVCRTHGLPLRMRGAAADDDTRSSSRRRPLKVLGDDVEVCALNFTTREPAAEDVLDAERLAALLLVVEQRFRAREGRPGPTERVALASLAPLRAPRTSR